MFKEDKDIDFYFEDTDSDNKTIKLLVRGADKADALTKLLPSERYFGNITVSIRIVPKIEDRKDKVVNLFRKAFEGNPAVFGITTSKSIWGDPMTFIIFKPKVVQYYTDEMFNPYGIKTTIYQDLAEEIFGKNGEVFFCTEKV